MCGIIGYVGGGGTVEKLIAGLASLEYRGYDSSGIAYFRGDEKIETVKSAGRLDRLRAKLGDSLPVSDCGIGHTRWATHGEPSDVNAHPHGTENLSIVHNGIIENYAELKEFLTKKGYSFVSGTDTEVAAKLLDYHYLREGEPRAAIAAAARELRGSYALGILFAGHPGEIYALRCGSPLIVALGDGGEGNYIASDIPAFLKYTKRHFRLEEGEVALLRCDSLEVCTLDGTPVQKEIVVANWTTEAAERGGFPHFMLKEIHEEPRVIAETVRNIRMKQTCELLPERFADGSSKLSRIHIVACGTAMHAGLIGKQFIEAWARIPVNVALASEFRYENPIIGEDDIVIIISQSGETADTLAALRLARERGVHVLAVVNVVGSSIAREADRVIYTLAGPEIAVASTKAYSSQIAVMYPLALRLAELSGTMTHERAEKYFDELVNVIPDAVGEIIKAADEVKKLSEIYSKSEDVFFIGRGVDCALSQEGSLKLKEISYIHCEAYAAGELKHGTISLITEGVPVIAIATVSALYDKMVSNIKEVRARGASVIMIVGPDVTPAADVCDHIIRLPRHSEELSPFTAIAILQLFAYYMSLARGCDVDRPRNLAKSVTVE